MPGIPQSCLDAFLVALRYYEVACEDQTWPLRAFRVCHTVETCVNGKEALKLLRDKDKNFDLVLSDVYMPGAHRNPAQCFRAWESWPPCSRPVCLYHSLWWMQTWTGSDYWNKWGWRWICQSSVSHIDLCHACTDLHTPVIC